jgi:hypothetical protein
VHRAFKGRLDSRDSRGSQVARVFKALLDPLDQQVLKAVKDPLDLLIRGEEHIILIYNIP